MFTTKGALVVPEVTVTLGPLIGVTTSTPPIAKNWIRVLNTKVSEVLLVIVPVTVAVLPTGVTTPALSTVIKRSPALGECGEGAGASELVGVSGLAAQPDVAAKDRLNIASPMEEVFNRGSIRSWVTDVAVHGQARKCTKSPAAWLARRNEGRRERTGTKIINPAPQ